MIKGKKKNKSKKMKKISLLLLINIFFLPNLYSAPTKDCKTKAGITKVLKNIDCAKKNGKFKLNTKSKLTDVLTGKTKMKVPNPIDGLKSIGKAIKPSALGK